MEMLTKAYFQCIGTNMIGYVLLLDLIRQIGDLNE